MSLGHIVEDFYKENIGGAFIHGLLLPYCLASDIPRFVRNAKNNNYPAEVFENGKFEEYNETHPGPAHRFTSRVLGTALSVYGTASVVSMTDVTAKEAVGVMLVTNTASLLYSEVPAVKKAVKGVWKFGVDAVYAFSRCI